VTRCPICKSEAAEIDPGPFNGVGFDCRLVASEFLALFWLRGKSIHADSGNTR
jgi:hypothetical protein